MKRPFPILALLFVMTALLLTATAALAHQPRYNNQGSPSPDDPFVIETIDVSLAIYGALTPDAVIDYYRIDVPTGHRLNFQVFVPQACSDALRPSIALLGADVEAGFIGLTAVPDFFQPVAGTAVRAATLPAEQWGSFFEPFSGTTYFSGPELTHTAQGGTYYVAVFNTDGGTGTYLLSMAGREAFDREMRVQDADYEACELPPRARAVAAAPVEADDHVHDDSHDHDAPSEKAVEPQQAAQAQPDAAPDQPQSMAEAQPSVAAVVETPSSAAGEAPPPAAASVAVPTSWLLLAASAAGAAVVAVAAVALRRRSGEDSRP